MKTLFIYEGLLDNKLFDYLGEGQGGVIVVNLSEDIYLKDKFPWPIDIRQINDYLTARELEEVISESRENALSLLSFLGPALNYADELPLLDVMRYDNTIMFIELYKNIRLLERIFKTEGQFRLVLYRNNSLMNDCALAFSKQNNLPLEILQGKEIKRQLFRKYERIISLHKLCAVKIFKLGQRFISLVRGTEDNDAQHILVTYYPRFIPLIERLSQVEGIQLSILGGGKNNRLRFLRSRDGLRYLMLLGYIPFLIGLHLLLTSSALRTKIIKRCSIELSRVKIFYRNVDISPLLQRHIFDYLGSFLFNYVCFFEGLKRLLRQEKIDTVIMNEDSVGYHKILLMEARRQGLRTITFQHGLFHEVANSHYVPYESDEVFVWGQREKEFYVRHGLTKEDAIRISGDSFLLNLKNRIFDRAATCTNLGINPNKRIVLFVCDRYINLFLPYIRTVTSNVNLDFFTRALKGESDFQLIVRMKSSQAYSAFYGNPELKKDIIRRNGGDSVIVDSTSNIYDLLYISDIVIVNISTTGIEAMLFGKPVIVLNIDANNEHFDSLGYVSSQGAVGVFQENEFLPVLQSLLSDRERKNNLFASQQVFLRRNFANFDDSDPLQRIEDLIIDRNQQKRL